MVLLNASEPQTSMKKIRKFVWLILLGISMLMIAVVLSLVDSVQIITSYRMRVTKDSIVTDFMSKPIVGARLSAYLFNITNAQRFLSGEDYKLKMEQIGPFTDEETRHNDNFELDEEAGLMRYSVRTEMRFVREESVANPDDVNVTLPNLAMLGVTTKLISFPYFTKAAFNLLTSQLNSQPIITLDASTFLWGYKDPLISLVHTLAPGVVHFKKLGILDRIYDKHNKHNLEVSARDEDKFTIQTRNGYKKLPMGDFNDPDSCEICDDFTNVYEGLSFPSPITPETPIRLFRPGLCRILQMHFHKVKVFDSGVEGLVYKLNDSFFSLDPNITKNRMLDLQSCFYGIPVVLTKTHFGGMDPEMYERIEGINPENDKDCYVTIEPKVSLPVEIYFAVQMNLHLPDVSFNKRASRLSNMILPIGIIAISQPPLPEDTQSKLRLMYVTAPMLLQALKIILIYQYLCVF